MAMKRRRSKWLFIGLPIVLVAYIGIYLFLYSIKDQQTKQYRSTVLPSDFKFRFNQPTEELSIKAPQGGLLNALLFKAPQAKGVICFWKGGGGTLPVVTLVTALPICCIILFPRSMALPFPPIKMFSRLRVRLSS